MVKILYQISDIIFRFPPVAVGSNVRVPVPNVDRAKGDLRNITAVVLEDQNGLYKLGLFDFIKYIETHRN